MMLREGSAERITQAMVLVALAIFIGLGLYGALILDRLYGG